MNPQSMTIAQIDNELIYDTNHILMNYLKMQSFSQNCFSETNITISESIINTALNQEIIQEYNKFSTKYFTLFSVQENVIDILCPLISSYPNSEFGLFLAILLHKHILDISQSLESSQEKFEKYKNYLLNIYHSILQVNKKQKLIESICSSITILIVIGINGNWTNGLEQLIGAAKENNGGNLGNILMASLIISNINDTIEKLKEKMPKQNVEAIENYIKVNTNSIKEFSSFLISAAFNGPKEQFANTPLFKAFIGIVQSFKYFDINIIKIHGFLDFLINCTSYIDINQDLILQICDIFDHTFKDKSNVGLLYECKSGYTMKYFITFLNNISNHNDFPEIKKCIELIMNVKNFYSNKNINEIKNNPKDIQILFASCNIFGSLMENFGYLIFLPEIDTVVQDIFSFFINLPIYNISRILLNSLCQIKYYTHYGYKFDNYLSENNIANAKLKFNNFLYKIHDCVFQKMKLSSMNEYNNIDLNSLSLNNTTRLDTVINEILNKSIDDDEKNNYIINATDFYEDLYEIINDLYGIKDFCEKLCQYLMSAVNNNELIIIDCIFIVLNKFAFKLNNDLPDIIFNMIDFILNGNNNQVNLLNNMRFTLQFIRLIFIMRIYISKNIKYVNIIIQSLLKQKYNEDKMNLLVIYFINKLIITSYQNYKINKNKITFSEDNKNNLMNLFNALSQYLVNVISEVNHIYLLKLIDCVFTSCFYSSSSGIISNTISFNIAEKLFKDANQIINVSLNQNNGKKELYMKYIHIIFSIIKNIGNENSSLLFELYNKQDPNPNTISQSNNVSYFANIESNIINIIGDCSENSKNSDLNIINSLILLCNTAIKLLKEKTGDYYNNFSNIISLIHKQNPNNIKIFDLTIVLYKNIFTYCKNDKLYSQLSEMFFDILNIMNSKYNIAKTDDENLSLSSKICEFILLYIPNFSHILSQICDKQNKNNSIFSYGFIELINTFENNDNNEYNNLFTTLVKSICDINLLSNYIADYANRLITAIITHLQYFKSNQNKCAPNYFIILKYFWTNTNEKCLQSLKSIFKNDNQIIFAIGKYLDKINYKNYNNLEEKIKDNNNSFINELGELLHAMDTKKIEFVTKYVKIVDEMNKNERLGLKFSNNYEKNISHISLIHK